MVGGGCEVGEAAHGLAGDVVGGWYGEVDAEPEAAPIRVMRTIRGCAGTTSASGVCQSTRPLDEIRS
eukprot:8675796-Prorocentrum_lima.AAC.1